MVHDDLHAHLAFFEALGVTGVRREPAWRRRAVPDPAPAGRRVHPSALEDAAGEPGASARSKAGAETAAAPAVVAAVLTGGAAALEAIRLDLGPDCRRCKLHGLGRRQIVFGVGDPEADLMFVGEGPGADEDIQGEPFVGRAGQLLTRIIQAIDLRRDQVYIANIVKCRPPGNRNPEPDEIDQCQPFIARQIEAVRPRVIVALGKVAAQALLHTSEPITRMRGREYRYGDAVLIPTYHPAYLLRNPEAKRDVWEDMKRVRAILRDGVEARTWRRSP
jgi:uracil-DNA glycosylase